MSDAIFPQCTHASGVKFDLECVECQLGRLKARAERAEAAAAALREPLALAQSVIKCGEPWTETCERVIGGALSATAGEALLAELRALREVERMGRALWPCIEEDDPSPALDDFTDALARLDAVRAGRV